ncbi:MAG: hypothetical protein A2X29_04970 [Elusimicrobia bacterium GWA2_64_40]|nr:MAG: hypothetical protein A2X29_04970 [Elusimicrobia bacterium GWA2_64_40]
MVGYTGNADILAVALLAIEHPGQEILVFPDCVVPATFFSAEFLRLRKNLLAEYALVLALRHYDLVRRVLNGLVALGRLFGLIVVMGVPDQLADVYLVFEDIPQDL